MLLIIPQAINSSHRLQSSSPDTHPMPCIYNWVVVMCLPPLQLRFANPFDSWCIGVSHWTCSQLFFAFLLIVQVLSFCDIFVTVAACKTQNGTDTSDRRTVCCGVLSLCSRILRKPSTLARFSCHTSDVYHCLTFSATLPCYMHANRNAKLSKC